MDITRDNLTAFFEGLNTRFRAGISKAAIFYTAFATTVQSSNAQELHRWMGQAPQLREWIGKRVIRNIETEGFTVVNRKYEQTIEVKRDDISDDSFGIYGPLVGSMGQVAARHPDKLAAALLDANTAAGYDGVPLFSAAHPVGSSTVSNFDPGGGGQRWYLYDSKQELQLLLHQQREALELVSLTNMDDPAVFDRDAYQWGTRVRYAMAPGFWQAGFASHQPLNATNFENAYNAIMNFKDANGEPMGIIPDTLMVSVANRANALDVIKAERDAAGATNINRNAVANVIVNPWLTA